MELETGEVLEAQGLCQQEHNGIVFPQTNNLAEYSALCHGLRKALELGVTDILVQGDSQLVIYQITGKYKVNRSKYPHLGILWDEAQSLISKFPPGNFKITWQDQTKNKADSVSRVTKKSDTIQRSTKSSTGKITIH